jgi:WD40 repeat protein
MKADRRRLEIVHESLLTRWPRLARWRAQDEEGAVLRDQLRQAAQSWEQHARADDFLWTGTAFREYQLWRERYPGGLTTVEEAFADAMTGLAHRRRRRRRMAIAAAFTLLATAAAVFAVLRQQAVAEARRAEASKLLALGQVELERTPTAALAYAIKSLELDDSPAARVFAVKALAAGPPAVLHPVGIVRHGPVNRVGFSPDGAWAVVVGAAERLHVISRDGGDPRDLEPFPSGTGGVAAVFDADSRNLYAAKDGVVKVWSVPGFRLVETQRVGGTFTSLRRRAPGILAITRVRDEPPLMEVSVVSVGERPSPIGGFDGSANWDLGPDGTSLALARNKELLVGSLLDAAPPRRVGAYEGRAGVVFHPAGDRLAAYDGSRRIRLWSTAAPFASPVRELAPSFEPLNQYAFDSDGRRVAAIGTTADGLGAEVWDHDAPPSAGPQRFAATFGGLQNAVTFTPDGRWVATSNFHAVCFWPTTTTQRRELIGHRTRVNAIRFTPDGTGLVSRDTDGVVRRWGLGAAGGSEPLARLPAGTAAVAMDPQGRFVAAAQRGGALVIPLDGSKPRALEGFLPTTQPLAVAIDRDGRRVAAASYLGPREDKVIRVWELDTGAVWTLGPTEKAGEGGAGQNNGIGFLADGSLISAGDGLRLWSIEEGTHELIAPSHVQTHLRVFPDGRTVAYMVGGDPAGDPIASQRRGEMVWLAITDVKTRRTRILRSHGRRFLPFAVHPSGRYIATGGLDGIVRIGPVTGEEPHLLMGHEGWIHGLDISADGRWIAATGDDRKIHVWPVPDMSKPPLHTLPRAELITRLKSLTNLRVVEESKSRISAWLRTDRGTGYELDLEPFPGWANPPEY